MTQLKKLLLLVLYYSSLVESEMELPLCSTCIPALGVSILRLLQPGLVPRMGEVHQQDKLDNDEDERTHHAEVIPH